MWWNTLLRNTLHCVNILCGAKRKKEKYQHAIYIYICTCPLALLLRVRTFTISNARGECGRKGIRRRRRNKEVAEKREEKNGVVNLPWIQKECVNLESNTHSEYTQTEQKQTPICIPMDFQRCNNVIGSVWLCRYECIAVLNSCIQNWVCMGA